MSNSSERSKPLGFDLRAKIAAIQVGHYPWLYDRTLACTCGEYRSEPDLFRQWGDHVADVLIRELGLHREFGLQFDKHPTDVVMGRETNPDGTVTQVFEMSETRARQALDSPAPIGGVNKRVVDRYVTEWETE